MGLYNMIRPSIQTERMRNPRKSNRMDPSSRTDIHTIGVVNTEETEVAIAK